MNSEGEPPQKEKKTNLSPSLLSLPDEIIANCLACISTAYYPELSLVCKTFRSLILSTELFRARRHLGNHDHVFHVCLQLPDRQSPSWFSLWIKPDQTLTNNWNKCSRNVRLVQTPSSYSPRVPFAKVMVGSECYAFSPKNSPSSTMQVKGINGAWRNAPNMTLARERALAVVLNEKIYVTECCGTNGSSNWAEVFDPKTQTWETLPDPGIKIRSSKLKRIGVIKEKLYLRSYDEKEDYVYDPNEGKWDVVVAGKRWGMCVMTENVRYACYEKNCLWYDKNLKGWRAVRGLDVLNENVSSRMIELANYGGKLLMFGDKLAGPGRNRYKFIWCAVIALERRDDGEVWGNIEWANVVLKVPSSYVYLRSQVNNI